MMSSSRGRARIGVLVPYTNTNLEADFAFYRPSGVSLHFARLGGYDADAVPDAEQMAGLGEAPLDEPLHLLAGARPDIVLYGCTSATLAHGPAFDNTLAARIRDMMGATSVTAAGALVNTLQAFEIKRIGFASPYVTQLNDRAVAFLSDSGFEIVSRADIGATLGNYGQSALTPDQVFDLGRRADSAEAEAIVLSCTDMRAMETIERLESALGKPVISSNQALLFTALQVLGIEADIVGGGRLLRASNAA